MMKKFVKKQTTLFVIIGLPPRVKTTRNMLKIQRASTRKKENFPVGVFLTYFFCGKATDYLVLIAFEKVMPEGADHLARTTETLNETSYTRMIITQGGRLCLLLEV